MVLKPQYHPMPKPELTVKLVTDTTIGVMADEIALLRSTVDLKDAQIAVLRQYIEQLEANQEAKSNG